MITTALAPTNVATPTGAAAPRSQSAATPATTNTQDTVSLSQEVQDDPPPPGIPPEPSSPSLPPLPQGPSALDTGNNVLTGVSAVPSVLQIAQRAGLLGDNEIPGLGPVGSGLSIASAATGAVSAFQAFESGNNAAGFDDTIGAVGSALAAKGGPYLTPIGLALNAYSFFDEANHNAVGQYLFGNPKPITTPHKDGTKSVFEQGRNDDGAYYQTFQDEDGNNNTLALETYLENGNGSVRRDLVLPDPDHPGAWQEWRENISPDDSEVPLSLQDGQHPPATTEHWWYDRAAAGISAEGWKRPDNAQVNFTVGGQTYTVIRDAGGVTGLTDPAEQWTQLSP